MAGVRANTGDRAGAEVVPAATNHPFGAWSDAEHGFVVAPGEYVVYVGTSSEETPHVVALTVS